MFARQFDILVILHLIWHIEGMSQLEETGYILMQVSLPNLYLLIVWNMYPAKSILSVQPKITRVCQLFSAVIRCAVSFHYLACVYKSWEFLMDFMSCIISFQMYDNLQVKLMNWMDYIGSTRNHGTDNRVLMIFQAQKIALQPSSSIQ